jgi:hypothetical protein
VHQYNCGVSAHDIHYSQLFLPWHRAFLYLHERMLQAELGDRDFRIPAWDWENSGKVPEVYEELPSIHGMPCLCRRMPGPSPLLSPWRLMRRRAIADRNVVENAWSESGIPGGCEPYGPTAPGGLHYPVCRQVRILPALAFE